MGGSSSKLPTAEKLRKNLSGKTVCVVGANAGLFSVSPILVFVTYLRVTGLGFEASKQFAVMKPERLILACRNPTKAAAAVTAIQESTGCKVVEAAELDLSSFASVISFSDRIQRDVGKLDILVVNAGIATRIFHRTKDGWESSVQVNHLSGALLSILLLPTLLKAPKSDPARLVTLTSSRHFKAQISELQLPDIFEKLSDPKHCAEPGVMAGRYSVSKVFPIFLTRSLASRLPLPSSLIVDSADPGWCATGLANEIRTNFIVNMIFTVLEKTFARTAEEGGRILVHAAVAPGDEVHGKYLATCQVSKESDFVNSKAGKEAEEKIWHETIAVLSKVDPRVPQIVREHLEQPQE